MDFSIAEPLMLRYGITPEQIAELKALAAKLPPDIVDGSRLKTPKMPGLSMYESELLIARMLEAIEPLLGMEPVDEGMLDLAGYPTMHELMKLADQRLHARRGKRGPIRLRRSPAPLDGENAVDLERLHERV